MAKILNDCDKIVRKVLLDYECQTSHQICAYAKRVFGESYSVGSIGAALCKMALEGRAACSPNEKGQKVYWLTQYGIENMEAM